MLAAVSSFVLMDSLYALEAFKKAVKPIAQHWVLRLNEYCSDLKKEAITTTEWQDLIDSLYREIELSELLRFIEFDRLKKGFEYPDLGVNTKRVSFPKLTGLPDQTVFVKKIFGMKKDRAIIPHGHSNMASAHLILEGEMHLRHFEKIRSEEASLIIQPTIDKQASPGTYSFISDEKDNIHWFIANTETAFTFDVIMLDLNNEPYDIHNLDMYAKQDLPDGTSRVPVLDVETALRKYGKETHH